MNELRKEEMKAILLIAICILSFISLISYNPNDIAFNTSEVNIRIKNLAGNIGAYFAWFTLFSFGYSAYLIPMLALIWAFGMFKNALTQNIILRIFGSLVLFLTTASFLSLLYYFDDNIRMKAGGIAGLLFSEMLFKYFGKLGSFVIILTLFILSLLLATECLILPLLKMLASKLINLIRARGSSNISIRQPKTIMQGSKDITSQKEQGADEGDDEKAPSIFKPVIDKITNKKKDKIKINEPKKIAATSEDHRPLTASGSSGDYNLPPLSLLKDPVNEDSAETRQSLQNQAAVLEGTLADFGIEAKVVQIDKGPVVTRYELQPAAGVKVQKIVTLSDDIALAMKAVTVRVVAPIPGKNRVGIEVPNSKMNVVNLKEILASEAFKNARSKLTLALGKDIAGAPVVCDLGTMPHLLIAGTTGSGKTVCVNSIITSMLFSASPDEIKFIMVDPKMVELAPYNGLPHLLCPVITNAKKVSAALNWTVNEMESRYQMLADETARNIEAYNKKVADESKMPYIVVVIDELADLMVVASQEIENAITRLSQLSRAVGIHIILATQRPSVDVITGVIKANFPTRISFKVASKVDSRTVLDANGADKLIGRGDMLFLPPGSSKLIRAQAPLVTDEEIESIVEHIKQQRPAEYNEAILKEQKQSHTANVAANKSDEMYPEAVKVVLETKHASVSMIQRRLRLGYTRAARLIDAMEDEGIVGPYQGSKAREILVDPEEYLSSMQEE
jgi:S-DNA-T family DNA segregation ATPase FtsK/SpoIIIE